MTIYAIIVTYNGRKWVDFCLGSLRRSTVSIVPLVIDNGSKDDTVAYIRKHYPEAKLFVQQDNLGFGQANNVGLRYALEHGADYCLLLNQDAAIEKDAVEKMLAQSDGKSLLSPIHCNGSGTKLDNSFRDASLAKCKELLNDAFVGEVKECYECGEICAACWFLPRKVIETIGGFNPLFFHYSEDNNYYQRLKYHKVRVLLVPNARMYHDRIEYGNKRVWNEQWIRNHFILACSDINLSILQRIYKLVHILWTCYAYRLKQGEYKVGRYIIALVGLIGKSSAIRKSRVMEKRVGKNWL